MSNFHESIRNLLEDVQLFLVVTLQNEALTSSTNSQKDNLLVKLVKFNQEYPQLHLSLITSSQSAGKNLPNRPDSAQDVLSGTPLPYVDMNSGNSSIVSGREKGSYETFVLKDRPISKESHSFTESEDTPDEGDKNYPEIAAKELYSCEKYGYLEKKKRDSLKGWLNPFQKRWCGIKDGVLYYYEKSTDRKQKGSISLAGYEARQIHEMYKDGKKNASYFELVCPGRRTYQFACTSEDDRKQWISVIEQNNKVSLSGISKSQDLNRRTTCTIDSSDSVPYITEDIYEIVEDVECFPENNSNFEIRAEDKSSSEKCYTDAESVKTQNEVFNHHDWYVGLWDCWGTDDTELNFKRGDYIHIVSKEYDSLSWWVGELQGKIGFVPKSFLMEAYEPC